MTPTFLLSHALAVPVLQEAATAATGYTSPSGTYNVMRQIERASAAPMNQDVEAYVASTPFKAAWRAFYKAWLVFFNTYASERASTWDKVSALAYSDEVAERTESFRAALEDFYRTYPAELDAAGRLVPPARGTSPLTHTLPVVTKSYPWWVYVAGIGALGAIGYAGYRRFSRPTTRMGQKRKRRSR